MKQDWWDSITLVEGFLEKLDWRIRENANMTYSLQAMNFFVSAEITKRYWLSKVYSKEAAKMHMDGFFHIHDMGTLSTYCVGWDFADLIKTGLTGVPGKVDSRPAKHYRAILGQSVNFMYTLQGEAAGAQAFSDFDILLAPFVRADKLEYEEVKQGMQEFVYNMNVPTRVGFQTPFTNITMDVTIPSFYKEAPVVLGGKETGEVYGDYADEIDTINKAFVEVMTEGDAKGRPFTFPIPTYNISKDWDWGGDISHMIMEMTAKYGTPYFANFVNSDLQPDDVRSMCCRLRLDTRELRKRNGGLFASAPLTGSIGVVTLNMGRIGYLSKEESQFMAYVDDLMRVAKETLMVKRDFLEKMTTKGLYPYSKFYLRQVKELEGKYWSHHFNTIGLIGMSEGLLNFMGEDISTPDGKRFAEKVLDRMLENLKQFQDELGVIFNLEATPGEGTTYRFAKLDRRQFGKDIILAGKSAPYYTNSTWLPVDHTGDVFDLFEHQESLQRRYTGGTVIHTWLGEAAEPSAVESLVRKAVTNFSSPYYTITPTYSICPVHGHIAGKYDYCPYSHAASALTQAGLMKDTGLAKFNI
ncbi:MAG: ribonucleoside triphosphate reductase [Candidatus Altiarchaeota archaeon]|nr:ribonucleoside triphosphate reductase [Candidatus Altiarchaeota archaeon]